MWSTGNLVPTPPSKTTVSKTKKVKKTKKKSDNDDDFFADTVKNVLEEKEKAKVDDEQRKARKQLLQSKSKPSTLSTSIESNFSEEINEIGDITEAQEQQDQQNCVPVDINESGVLPSSPKIDNCNVSENLYNNAGELIDGMGENDVIPTDYFDKMEVKDCDEEDEAESQVENEISLTQHVHDFEHRTLAELQFQEKFDVGRNFMTTEQHGLGEKLLAEQQCLDEGADLLATRQSQVEESRKLAAKRHSCRKKALPLAEQQFEEQSVLGENFDYMKPQNVEDSAALIAVQQPLTEEIKQLKEERKLFEDVANQLRNEHESQQHEITHLRAELKKVKHVMIPFGDDFQQEDKYDVIECQQLQFDREQLKIEICELQTELQRCEELKKASGGDKLFKDTNAALCNGTEDGIACSDMNAEAQHRKSESVKLVLEQHRLEQLEKELCAERNRQDYESAHILHEKNLLEELESRMSEERRQLDYLDETLRNEKKRIEEEWALLHAERSLLKEDAPDEHQIIRELDSDLENLESELQSERQRLEELEARLEEEKRLVADDRASLQAERCELTRLEKELRAEVNHKDNDSAVEKQRLMEVEAKLSVERQQLEELEARLLKEKVLLEDDRAKLLADQHQLTELRSELQDERCRHDEDIKDVMKEKSELVNLESELQSERQRLEELEAKLEEEKRLVADDRASLQAERCELTRLEKELRAEVSHKDNDSAVEKQRLMEVEAKLSVERQQLEELEARLLKEKVLLEDDRAKLLADQHQLTELRSELQDERCRHDEDIKDIMKEKSELENLESELQSERQRLEELEAKLEEEKRLVADDRASLQVEQVRPDEEGERGSLERGGLEDLGHKLLAGRLNIEGMEANLLATSEQVEGDRNKSSLRKAQQQQAEKVSLQSETRRMEVLKKCSVTIIASGDDEQRHGSVNGALVDERVLEEVQPRERLIHELKDNDCLQEKLNNLESGGWSDEAESLDFFQDLEYEEKEAARKLALIHEAESSKLADEYERQTEIARNLEIEQLKRQSELSEVRSKLNDLNATEKERQARLDAEKKMENLQVELASRHSTVSNRQIADKDLELAVSVLTHERDSLLAEIHQLKTSAARRHQDCFEISQLKPSTNSNNLPLEAELMHAKNEILNLEASLKAAEKQMELYIEVEREHRHVSGVIQLEFTCMENHLRRALEEKSQYEDKIISLETTNAELQAALKVERMLRLKNFRHFNEIGRNLTGSNFLASPSDE